MTNKPQGNPQVVVKVPTVEVEKKSQGSGATHSVVIQAIIQQAGSAGDKGKK